MPRPRIIPDDIVLERAIDVFWQHGYAGTSLRDLTRATGLSAAALYHRFTDKDGLFVEALRRYAEEGLAGRLAGLAAAPDPLAAIADFLDQLIAMSLADPLHRGCLLVNTALDGAAMSERARAIVRARLHAVEEFFAGRLKHAVAKGTLAPRTDIAATAAALLGTVFAIRVLARLDPDRHRLRALADHAIAGLAPMRPTRPAPARAES